jgi:hypothetical protein
MHYAVPTILFNAELLTHLYTDLTARSWLGRATSGLAGLTRLQPAERLAARRAPELPREVICEFPSFGLEYWIRKRLSTSGSELLRTQLWAGKEICIRTLTRGLDNATHIYAFNSAALELMEAAKHAGKISVLEQTSAPREVYDSLMQSEIDHWPEWAVSGVGRNEWTEAFATREAAEWAAADLILCGSQFVVDGIRSVGGPTERCRVVPYGVDPPRLSSLTPKRLRSSLNVLYCGTVMLQKGLPYLADAAAQLAPSRFNFRLVGPTMVPPSVLKRLRQRMEVVGPVPKANLSPHYRWADVLVLPSICEGSATVCYEAMAHGVPVVVTPHCGAVARHGYDGLLVAIRDSNAIASSLDRLLSEQSLLESLSSVARATAKEYTTAAYGRRLLRALNLGDCP